MQIKVEALLDKTGHESFVSNMKRRGFKSKAGYLRFLIEQDNPFIKSLRDELIDLKLDVKNVIKNNDESQFEWKKLAYLNYKTFMLLLGYFADATPSQEAIEKTKKYIAKREKEFEDYWQKKNRKW